MPQAGGSAPTGPGTWTTGMPMPTTRTELAVALLDDKIYVAGGFGAAVIDGRIYVAGGEVLVAPLSVRDTVEMFDPATGMWTFKADLPMPLHGTGAVAYDGKMYLFGGVSNPASANPRMGGVNIFTP